MQLAEAQKEQGSLHLAPGQGLLESSSKTYELSRARVRSPGPAGHLRGKTQFRDHAFPPLGGKVSP